MNRLNKVMNCLAHAEPIFERIVVLAALCALVIFLLTGCGCGCTEKGTLQLRDNYGNYVSVCRGTYFPSSTRSIFKCDDGRKIMQPVNFIIQK